MCLQTIITPPGGESPTEALVTTCYTVAVSLCWTYLELKSFTTDWQCCSMVPLMITSYSQLLVRIVSWQVVLLMVAGMLLRGWKAVPYVGWVVAPVVS